MKIKFWKMHGAGNDMILVDDREETFPAHDREWMAHIGRRQLGIGCDGFILIRRSEAADFGMRFYNPDGGEAEMCGNGARCVARLAHELGIAPASMRIDTVAGIVGAEIVGERVRLHMTPPHDWRLRQHLQLEGQSLEYSFVNSGVPHVMLNVDELATADVAGIGAAVRHHADFAPAGTNVNFVAVTGPRSLRLRTYERGVEAETLACGTGIVACALLAGRLGLVATPVELTCGSGDVLEVDYELDGEGAQDVVLLGPAEHVFEGVVTYGAGGV